MNPNTRFHTRLRAAIDASVRDAKERNPEANAFGTYFEKINGIYVGVGTVPLLSPNLLPTQGLNNALDTWMGDVAKPAGWYLALYSGAVTPAANWTAANFAANATEITSLTEGYSEATRPQWVKAAAAANGSIDNVGTEAEFTIVCTTSINVNGVGCLSSNARGGTTGILASAARYALTRTLQNGDDYQVGWRTTFTST